MDIKSYLLLLAASLLVATAGADLGDRYSLPLSKVNIEPCRQEALLRHPGLIEEQRMLHRNAVFLVRHEIQTPEGVEWLVLCDLGTGKIINEQRLVDGKF